MIGLYYKLFSSMRTHFIIGSSVIVFIEISLFLRDNDARATARWALARRLRNVAAVTLQRVIRHLHLGSVLFELSPLPEVVHVADCTHSV
jgi:hypothetical protein